LFDTVAVSFSGGKDSTVCLNLALEGARSRGKSLLVFFFDEEAIPYETEHYVRRVAEAHKSEIELRWYCLPIQHRNACTRKSPFWYPWAPEDEPLWVRPLPPEAIVAAEGFPTEKDRRPSMPDSVPMLFDTRKLGRTVQILGIRADESLTRTRAILKHASEGYDYIRQWSPNLYKLYPIYDWSTKDVWTAPAKFQWDYNRAYDLMELAGISHAEQRCAPPYGEEPLRGLWTYQVCFPDIWDKMANRVPGSATAARYSTSLLYAFDSLPDKPAELTWPQFVKQWIEKHPQPWKSEIAVRVKRWIDQHYDKTQDLIAPKAPHPVTGISWTFLLQIAMRGDYKDRRQPAFDAPKERYDAEIKATPAKELIW
jgi:predicted phosphoadenosine phosphosulfate sulfurtransferase